MENEKRDGVAILVGESRETREKGLKTADFAGEEYAVKFFDHAVVLIGNDAQEFESVNYSDYRTFPSLDQNAHSTLYAVYDFLEHGVSGWFAEVFLECNFLESYLAMRICDKPEDNPRKALEEFFPRYFGPAAAPTRAYFADVEGAF